MLDDPLGIDLGGVHAAAGQIANLDTLFAGTRPSGKYSFNFFFAEPQTSESNLMISTSLVLTNNVPEPGSLALLGLGLAGLAGVRRRRKSRWMRDREEPASAGSLVFVLMKSPDPAR